MTNVEMRKAGVISDWQPQDRRVRILQEFTGVMTGASYDEAGYFLGATTVFVDTPGATHIPDGLWPCGLSAGAPPDCVSIDPAQPCGCNWPSSSGEVLPVLVVAELELGFPAWAAAHAAAAAMPALLE